VTKHVPPEGRNIHFHVLIDPHHPRLLELQNDGDKKPPTHFHPDQWEFFRVVRGSLTVEIDGVPHEFVESDGEYALPPGPHHCLYPTYGQPEGAMTEFWLGATPSGSISELDQAFFENWYGYQEDILLRGVKPDPIQVMSMFDAGGSYLSPPAWVPEPLRHHIGRAMGVVVGRWIGGLLGYAPFFPEWTTDWPAACRKMSEHPTQRRFADLNAQEKIRANYVKRAAQIGNEALYAEFGGYESWLAMKTKQA
jgi:mannose-6-phosphate isomerase-like protein (cupin superfamily)